MQSTFIGSPAAETPATTTTEQGHRIAALTRLTIAALLALAVLGVYLQTLIFRAVFPPVGIIMAAGSLFLAGVLTKPWRWSPALGAVWCGLMAAGNATAIVRDLGNPDDVTNFVFNLFALAVVAVGIASGIAAAVQNYRLAPADRRAPRWLPAALVGVAGVVLGATLVALVPRPTTADVSPETLSRLVGVKAGRLAFDRSEVHVKAGQPSVLRLDNGNEVEHSFDVDELNVHVYLPTGKTRLAVFGPSEPGTYTFYCAIPGHRDQMRGTLVVDP